MACGIALITGHAPRVSVATFDTTPVPVAAAHHRVPARTSCSSAPELCSCQSQKPRLLHCRRVMTVHWPVRRIVRAAHRSVPVFQRLIIASLVAFAWRCPKKSCACVCLCTKTVIVIKKQTNPGHFQFQRKHKHLVFVTISLKSQT